MKVSGGIAGCPSDLRAVAGPRRLPLLPTDESDSHRCAPIPRSRRLERLERMERDLHARGLAYRPADEPPA